MREFPGAHSELGMSHGIGRLSDFRSAVRPNSHWNPANSDLVPDLLLEFM
jgi:hypothetical protein